ncbi:hypothetical protein Taro_009949, partial [Colocasia esculenta]|nr:hypothetical protein [Colocasia esculenta]
MLFQNHDFIYRMPVIVRIPGTFVERKFSPPIMAVRKPFKNMPIIPIASRVQFTILIGNLSLQALGTPHTVVLNLPTPGIAPSSPAKPLRALWSFHSLFLVFAPDSSCLIRRTQAATAFAIKDPSGRVIPRWRNLRIVSLGQLGQVSTPDNGKATGQMSRSRCQVCEVDTWRFHWSEVVSVAWDPHPREPVEGVLWATSVLKLAAELADTRAEGKMREVKRGAAAWPGCGVVCIYVLCGGSISLFRGACTAVIAWLCLVSIVIVVRGGTGVCGFPTSQCVWGPGWFCLWALDLVEAYGFPARFVCMMQEGCSCCYVSCVASVVARCVRAVVAWVAVDSLAGVFPVWRTIVGKSRCSMCRVASLVERCDTCLWLFVSLVLASCELWLRCIAWLPCVLGLRHAVVLVGVFWQVFPELCLGGSGG